MMWSTNVENISSQRNSFGLSPHFSQQNKYIPLKKDDNTDHMQSCQLFLEYCPVTVISGHLPAWPITLTSQLLHTAKKKGNRLPALMDNLHAMLFNFIISTLRWYISVF